MKNVDNKPNCREEVAKNTLPTQQNKNCSVVPLIEVLSPYVKVTLHYGYRLERWFFDKYFVIYRNDKVKKGYEVTARLLRKLAVHECKYLEKLNYSQSKAGD